LNLPMATSSEAVDSTGADRPGRPAGIPLREILEFAVLFGAAAVILAWSEHAGEPGRGLLLSVVAAWAACKTLYYFSETLRHLLDATAHNLPYHRFLLVVGYNMAQITLSFAIDFFCLQRIDPSSLSGIDSSLQGFSLLFECFYFSVLNFSFFGYGDITPAHVPGKIVMLLEVVTAFSTVIFLLSDFVSIREEMRRDSEPGA
ncbi:MAG: ion channel, partial [Alphaproteobacteria bacterium]